MTFYPPFFKIGDRVIYNDMIYNIKDINGNLAQLYRNGDIYTLWITLSHLRHADNPFLDYDVKCECGVDIIGQGKHSSYCPKYSIHQ